MRRRAALGALALIPLACVWAAVAYSGDISRMSWVHLVLFGASVGLWIVWIMLVRSRKVLGYRAVSIYLKPETERRVQWLALSADVSIDEWVARTVAQQSLVQYESRRPALPH